MRSEMIEFLRFGGITGILRKGERYLAVSGTKPVRDCSTNYEHAEYFDDFLKLRYSDSISEAERNAALERMAAEATLVLGNPSFSSEPTQIDLVISASELWLLPFEAATDAARKPLFVQRDKPLVLTRRIRHEFMAQTHAWSPVPRIALISASPKWAGPSVPLEQHKEAIRASLKPWIEPLVGYDGIPDERNVLYALDQATPESFRALFENAKKKPFTHVHILAHGIKKEDVNLQRTQLGFALSTQDEQAFGADFMLEALRAQGQLPHIVTLAICDGASQINTVVPYESVAQKLHLEGVPIVVASQLPLTFGGSVLLTQEFYTHLLGEDVRTILYRTRVALYEQRDQLCSHDWMSMVAYVQLPEGYSDYLREIRLKACLASLGTAQKWADQVVENGATGQAAFLRVRDSLHERIAELHKFLSQSPKGTLYQENAGLLGSAYKRLAELLAVRQRTDQSVPATQIREALQQAHAAYKQGYEHNFSHHWTGVQCLSLEVVLTGTIAKPGYWHAAVQAAQLAAEKPTEYWAWGSLLELWLLAAYCVGKDGSNEAAKALTMFKECVAKAPAPDEASAIESTRRQLNRYITWWTKGNGFFPQADADLSVPVQQLIQALNSPSVGSIT
jgi:hypothetical protein